MKNKKNKKKNYVGKHRSNPKYFKEKKLQSRIFNQLNILKVKSIKIIFLKKNKWKKKSKVRKKRKIILKKKEGKVGKKMKKCKNKKEKNTVDYCCNPQ